MADAAKPNPQPAVGQTPEEIRRTADELLQDAQRLIERSRALRERADALDRAIEERRRESGAEKPDG